MSEDNEVPRNCKLCPSYLKKDEVHTMFRKNIGAPMCARFGKVLGAPDILPVAEDALCERVASNCASFGKPKPKEPQGYLQTEVTLPHPAVVKDNQDNPPTDDDKSLVDTCLNCKFYVDDQKVMEKHGWAAGLCSATGRLIIPGRQSKEAAACSYKKPGVQNIFLGQMHLIPMYGEAKAYDPSPLGRWKKMKESGEFVDPVDYPTDKEVTDDDRAYGIRAWRRIDDPNGTGNFTYLPVFDVESFPEHEQLKIPRTGDAEHPEDYIDAKDYIYSVAVEWMELDHTPSLWGPPGVGKTELARHIAWLMCIPFDRISVTREMEVEDLIGKYTLLDGETKFQWGRLPHAWVRPRIILLDEPNAGPDAIWQRIRPLTDNSKQLVLDEAGAEIVNRHLFTFLIMAMNPAWDTRNVGVLELASADVSRLVHVDMELPPQEVEREILKSACEKDGWTPSDAMLDKLFQNSDEIRDLVADGSLPVTWGVRENMKVIRHLKWFEPLKAYQRAVADVLEPSTRDTILNVVRNNGGLDS